MYNAVHFSGAVPWCACVHACVRIQAARRLRELKLIIMGVEKTTAGDTPKYSTSERNEFYHDEIRLASSCDLDVFNASSETWSFATTLPLSVPPTMKKVGLMLVFHSEGKGVQSPMPCCYFSYSSLTNALTAGHSLIGCHSILR